MEKDESLLPASGAHIKRSNGTTAPLASTDTVSTRPGSLLRRLRHSSPSFVYSLLKSSRSVTVTLNVSNLTVAALVSALLFLTLLVVYAVAIARWLSRVEQLPSCRPQPRFSQQRHPTHSLVPAAFAPSPFVFNPSSFSPDASLRSSSLCFLSHDALSTGQWISCNHAIWAANYSRLLPRPVVSRYCDAFNVSKATMRQRMMGPLRPKRPTGGRDNASTIFTLGLAQEDSSCSLQLTTPEEARRLLMNRRLLFIGDSTMQELLMELIAFIEGSPHSLDFLLHSWVNQSPCDGRNQGHKYRTFHTAKYPSPALSLFNISFSLIAGGHDDECSNGGAIELQLSDVFQRKIATASHLCSNRTAHLARLQELWGLELDAAASTVEAREQQLQELWRSRDPVTGDKPELLEAADAAWLSASQAEVLSLVQSCDEAQPTEFELDFPASLRSTNPDPVPSFTHALYNAGQHHVGAELPARPPLPFLTQYTHTVRHMLSVLHNLSHTATWKDSTPVSTYPALVAMNAAVREVSAELGRRKGQSRALDVWPVETLLSGLDKADNRHCSFKDLGMRQFMQRDRSVRSIYCHTALQILLQQITYAQADITAVPTVV